MAETKDGERVVVVKRDILARVTAYGAAALAILGFAGSVLYTKYARESSPVGSNEVQAYLSNIQEELQQTRQERDSLKVDIERARVGGYLLVRQVTNGQMTYVQWIKFVDDSIKETKGLSSALNK